MTDTTYDPDADAVYIAIAPGRVARKRRTGSFLYEFDSDGRVVGIEIRSASRILAPGDWQKARRPKPGGRQRRPMADLHKGFIFIKWFSPRDVGSR
jgi:uncharacterized protein YuzE